LLRLVLGELALQLLQAGERARIGATLGFEFIAHLTHRRVRGGDLAARDLKPLVKVGRLAVRGREVGSGRLELRLRLEA